MELLVITFVVVFEFFAMLFDFFGFLVDGAAHFFVDHFSEGGVVDSLEDRFEEACTLPTVDIVPDGSPWGEVWWELA